MSKKVFTLSKNNPFDQDCFDTSKVKMFRKFSQKKDYLTNSTFNIIQLEFIVKSFKKSKISYTDIFYNFCWLGTTSNLFLGILN